MTTKHTPGPWIASTPWPGQNCAVYGGKINELTIALVYRNRNEPGEANARLIAAAPDLLAACQAVLAEFPALDGKRIESIKRICRAAIAKAAPQ